MRLSAVADPKILKRKRTEDNLSAPSSLIANAHNGKGGFLEKRWANRGRSPPPPPPEFATGCPASAGLMSTEACDNYLPEAPYYQSMWAERSGKISRSSLSSICDSHRRKAKFKRVRSGPQISPTTEGLPIQPLIFVVFSIGIGYMRVS